MQRLHWESGSEWNSFVSVTLRTYTGRGVGAVVSGNSYLFNFFGWVFNVMLIKCLRKGGKSQHIFEILTSITKKRDGLPNYS